MDRQGIPQSSVVTQIEDHTYEKMETWALQRACRKVYISKWNHMTESLAMFWAAASPVGGVWQHQTILSMQPAKVLL